MTDWQPYTARAQQWFESLRDMICAEFEAIEREAGSAAAFEYTPWQRSTVEGEGSGETGGGVRGVMKGKVFEKVGVNVSTVSGEFAPQFAKTINGADEDNRGFTATGISLVAHMANPHVPAVHMNTRFLTTQAAWFGGGADLTPYYLFDEDAAHFHRELRGACERYRPGSYPEMKRTCDAYFFLPHRAEHRGVGGIFFEDLGGDPLRELAFVEDVGRSFLPAWMPIADRRRSLPSGDREREWQEIRRGRYVEFNLLHDRGTVFGLETGGRTESILMSLPPRVQWRYDHHPTPGSAEARLLDVVRTPRDWA